jgi:hypothetical protein
MMNVALILFHAFPLTGITISIIDKDKESDNDNANDNDNELFGLIGPASPHFPLDTMAFCEFMFHL